MPLTFNACTHMNMSPTRPGISRLCGVTAVLLSLVSFAALANGPAPAVVRPVPASATVSTSLALNPAFAQTLQLAVGQAHVLNEPDVRRIAIGNGKVLQAAALDDRQVLVLPEAPGQTTLLVWGRQGPPRTHVIQVIAAEQHRVYEEVQALLSGQGGIRVRTVGDKILVEGDPANEEQGTRLQEVTRRYPGVINFAGRIGMERMISMDVKFIEMRRELLEDIGVRWNGSMNGPSFQVLGDAHRSRALQPGGTGESAGLEVRPRTWRPGVSLSLASSLTSRLQLMVQNGDAVILAEPRLSCRSGGQARFVAGGELPIPVSGALGSASVAFKEYGIKFDVSPVANSSGVIAARIATEISSINFEVAVKEVPGLIKRRAESEVNLREGETLVIAGLLTDEGSRNLDKVPAAGDLPVLGPLFRSRQFRDRQTELAVFITPRFVEGQPPPAVGSTQGGTTQAGTPQGGTTQGGTTQGGTTQGGTTQSAWDTAERAAAQRRQLREQPGFPRIEWPQEPVRSTESTVPGQ
ncbi:MAG: type II and III secretion system protein family protein [Burkholderiales bacterium]